MPKKSKRPCSYPNCPELIESGQIYCEQHKKKYDKHYDNKRGTATERGYNSRWRKAREMFLAEHPLCEECSKIGIVREAKVVDHVIAHKGNYKLFWNKNNWQSLCKECHDRKTAKEDGRFGR